MLWSARLGALLADEHASQTRRALADGVAVTAAAVIATAPLMAFQFEALRSRPCPEPARAAGGRARNVARDA